MYFLLNAPGCPVISNCGTPREKVSQYLDYYLKPSMCLAKSYIKDTGNFLNKLKEPGRVLQNSLLIKVDVAALYPSIPHEDGLQALSIKLEQRALTDIYTGTL